MEAVDGRDRPRHVAGSGGVNAEMGNAFWRRKQRELDLERELRSDLELEADEQREKGLSPEEARYAARRALGNTSLLKEDVRQAWGWTRWEILLQDFAYALRTLRKSPAFSLTALLTLALGIGASTAVFTVVDSIVLEPLAYRDGGQLVVAWEHVKFMSPDPTRSQCPARGHLAETHDLA